VFGPIVLTATLLFALGDSGGTLLAPREVEFPFDDAKRLAQGESDGGKLWRSHGLPDDGSPVPVVVFVHGMLSDGLRHHWLTVDPSGPWDARPFMEELVDTGQVPPLVVAAPSQTNADAYDPSKVFEGLDFDAFLDALDEALAPLQRVDRSRVIVIGHSASACVHGNGALAVVNAKTFVARALIAVDGCLAPDNAAFLASTDAVRDVIVSYQDQVWNDRPFGDFRDRWDQTVQQSWPRGLRIVERTVFEKAENAHMELVELTVRRWLPILLPALGAKAWTALANESTPTPTPEMAIGAIF
jgi:hypothetical protein